MTAAPPPPPRAATLLFAYGTLMRGFALHRLLVHRAAYLGEASVQGALVGLGAYPGLVAGEGTVRGELYALSSPELLAAIDREEGYNFERRLTDIMPAAGRHLQAWTYWYRGPRGRAVPIPDGDWRTRWR